MLMPGQWQDLRCLLLEVWRLILMGIIPMLQTPWLRRYCTLLQATMPHVPAVMPIEPKELLEFCSDAGYNCRLEPRGTWFCPPDYNVGMTDWERSLRLRCELGTFFL
jgi:hypothetical protein